MIRTICAAASLLLLGASPVLAGTISYSHSESDQLIGATGSYLVPQYSDPGGQPLLKVTLTVDADSSGGSTTFDNEDHFSGGTATVTIGSEIKVNGPPPGIGAQLIVRADPVNSNTGGVGVDNDGLPPDFIGTDSISVSGTGAFDSKSAFKTAAIDMAPYLGAGMVTVDWAALLNAGVVSTTGGGGSDIEFAAIRANFTATLTYEFVPEPASWVLMVWTGLAAAILAMKQRLRRRPVIV